MRQIQTNQIEWREVEIGELLDYEQPGSYIVQSEILKEKTKGSIPVLTANKSFILGYTKEKEGVYNQSPVILFDDFTTDTKFVDFKFKIKSSAMKLLRPKSNDVNLKFIFLMMKGIQLNFSTHKRYYLSVYQKRKILMPFKENKLDVEEQEKFVKILEDSWELSEKGKKIENLFKEYLKSIFYEMFYNKGFEEKRLNELAKLSMGGTPSTSIKSYWQKGIINWMKSGDIKGDYIYSIPYKISEEGFKKSNTTLYPKGTIVIALNGQGKTRGTTGILKIETTSNQSVVGIIIDKEKLISEYLHFNLKFRYDELRNLTGDDARTGLNLTILRRITLPLPPLPLQQKFSRIVEQVEKMKDSVNKTKQNSEELFNSLVSKGFRGEL